MTNPSLEGTSTHPFEEETKPSTSDAEATVRSFTKKRKFDRSNWNQEEKAILQEHLRSVGAYPTSEMLKTTTRRVQVWFQNQRQRGAVSKCQKSAVQGRYDMDYALVAKVLQDFTGKSDVTCMAEARELLQSMGEEVGDEMVEFALFHGCKHRMSHMADGGEYSLEIMDHLFLESIALNDRLVRSISVA